MQNLGGKQSVLWAVGKWSIAPRVLTSSRSCLAVIVVIIIAFDKEGEWRSNITACSLTWFSDAQDRYMFPGERNSLKPKWRRKETKCRREKPFDLRSSCAKMILGPLTFLRCLRIQPVFFSLRAAWDVSPEKRTKRRRARRDDCIRKLLFVLTLFLYTRWCKREFRTCWPMRGVFRGRWAALLWHLSIGLSYPLCVPTTEANTARELGLSGLHWGRWREAAKLSC